MEWLESLAGIEELESAEAFLDYFGVAYDPAQVRISRLHIMHRFHQALCGAAAPEELPGRHALAARLLAEAYQAFAGIPVREQSSLRVYQRLEPQFVPLSALREVRP